MFFMKRDKNKEARQQFPTIYRLNYIYIYIYCIYMSLLILLFFTLISFFYSNYLLYHPLCFQIMSAPWKCEKLVLSWDMRMHVIIMNKMVNISQVIIILLCVALQSHPYTVYLHTIYLSIVCSLKLKKWLFFRVCQILVIYLPNF